MKKAVFLTICITLISIQFGLAQSEKKVPAVVTATFMEKYPGIKASDWDFETHKGYYEAEFKMNDKKMEAYFGENGAWIATKSNVKIEEFPPAVFKSMTSGEYKDWTFHDYAILDTPAGKRYNTIAKYGNQTHDLKYNDAGLLVEKNVVK